MTSSLPARGAQATLTPIVVSATTVPIPVRGSDGKLHLAYELAMVNELSQPATLASVSVQNLDTGRTLLKLTGDSLKAGYMPTGGAPGAAPSHRLAAGQQGRVWLDVIVPDGTSFPLRLTHVISATFSEPNSVVPRDLTETAAPLSVPDRHPVVLNPPLEGARWIDGNGCCDEITPHRAAGNPLNGAARFAERFAVDFVRLDAKNRTHSGPVDDLKSYPFYGVPVKSSAAGQVVSIVDDLPDEKPGKDPENVPLAAFPGNHVIERLTTGQYVMYAHLKPGSTKGRVHVGQKVQAGVQIGQLGNSGNSDGPHLHFQVMDGPEPLAANGLPFVFSTMTLQGNVTGDPNDFAKGPGNITAVPSSLTDADNTMPLYRNEVTFPSG
ncbi:M23 family metallopeptidase [Streptomyces vinaceus]|uniref:M23 family metallopeptidase n=1 Tax=Streptomyces vinaceus TaxID=1960 RepID=UPI00380A2360